MTYHFVLRLDYNFPNARSKKNIWAICRLPQAFIVDGCVEWLFYALRGLWPMHVKIGLENYVVEGKNGLNLGVWRSNLGNISPNPNFQAKRLKQTI